MRHPSLPGEPFISIYNNHSAYYRLHNAFAGGGDALFSTCCAFVENGSGVTISGAYTASRHVGSGLVIKPFRPQIDYELEILFPLDRSQSKILDALVVCMKSHLHTYTHPGFTKQ